MVEWAVVMFAEGVFKQVCFRVDLSVELEEVKALKGDFCVVAAGVDGVRDKDKGLLVDEIL